jgi:hypothetical protein
MLFNRLQLFSFFYGIILFFIFGDTLLLVVFGETKTGTFVNNNHYSIKSNRSYYTRRYRSNHNYYKPVIQFTVTNNTYQFETTSNIDFEEGEKIKVIYHKSNPASAKVYSFFGLWWNDLIINLVPTIVLVSLFAGLMAKDEIIYLNFKKKPYFQKMKRVEFDIIRKDEFESENDKQKEIEIENETYKFEK